MAGSSTFNPVLEFLHAAGAGERGHAGGRRLLDHLVETAAIVRRWGQPEWLQTAALIHSVYGTESYRGAVVSVEERDELRAVAGDRAERLAWLFATVPRRRLIAGAYRWAPGLGPAPREDLDALALLHMANLAEQARVPDGSPGVWLEGLSRLASLVVDSEVLVVPSFLASLRGCSAAAEAGVREAYRNGVAVAGHSELSIERLALAAALCPVVAEPCAWLAYLRWRAEDVDGAREWASLGWERLRELGTSWDKRLGYSEWLAVLDALASVDTTPEPGRAVATDPREIYVELTGTPSPAAPAARASFAPGEDRFTRYMRRLADAPQPGGRVLYPELTARPFWDPASFPLARALQANVAAVRAECLGLGPGGFAPESERIGRTGEWDVRFFHERGRRHADTCAACPTTARLIEQHGGMLTAAGLSYLSRMRPRTHIAAHRGPTNLRLRCHLGLTVPDGDAGIRVGEEVGRWAEGECLVFDDSYEHEAWNDTDGDRLVLIVDLWHPDLSAAEMHLLAGLQRYGTSYARRLDRYWETNAAAWSEAS